MLKRLLCLFARHTVNRRRVWHDQINFRTTCEACGRPLLRDAKGWREFDDEQDASEWRAATPHGVDPGS